MSDESKLMERVCPKCGGDLKTGMFIGKDGVSWASALMCTPCNWVWEKPGRGAK